jgi:isopentenyl phosphate kinase
MEDTYILKLGGSIITDKKAGKPALSARAKEIVREVARVRPHMKRSRLIVLYGGGSFGHPLAHRYRLLDRPLSLHTLMGVGHTVSQMRELGTRLAMLFLEAGIPVLPLQTSSFTYVRRGHLHFSGLSILETVLENGGVPLFGGDVAFSDSTRTAIVSADALAVELARKFKNPRLFFATDTDGVYAVFPPRANERPLAVLDRAGVRKLLKTQKITATDTDVTGAMPGKLRALLSVRNTTTMIFNGNTRGSLGKILRGERLGTRIVL